MRPLRKVVFPVAGLGTRFLPASKVIAKEMLPVVDKPLIQYAAEEAIAAGAETLIFVINRNKRQISDHFDTAYELEQKLAKQNKHELLRAARDVLPHGIDTVYVVQQEALGLGHAVLCAKPVIGDEPFGVILPDDFIYNPSAGAMSQMVAHYESTGASVIAVEDVPRERTGSYGIVSAHDPQAIFSPIDAIVEKPKPDVAPSTLAVVGRYILDGSIFALLEKTQPGAGGEIQLTDGIAALIKQAPVHAFRFEGKRFDCGTKSGYVQATLRVALDDPDISAEIRRAAHAILAG
jgi:UTP--glucose-1-phosphate uridylyltransferase